MAYQTLISVDAFQQHFNPTTWALIDCSFDLSRPDWGENQYLSGHIPNAIYAHLNLDLSATPTSNSGRHPLPSKDQVIDAFSRWGISSQTQVIAYDQADGSIAARLWWLLRYHGHHSVAILDGGFAAWLQADFTPQAGPSSPVPSTFIPKLNASLMADHDFVKKRFGDPAWLFVDARTPQRYRGEIEPIDPVAGRIPGSVNRYYGENLDANGRYKSPGKLHAEWASILQGHDPKQVILYCGSGVTSCANLVAMEHAGLHGSLLYPGSWSQWITDPDLPISTGEENFSRRKP